MVFHRSFVFQHLNNARLLSKLDETGLLWLISKIKMLNRNSKAQLTTINNGLDILSFKCSSELQIEEIIQALVHSILQNTQHLVICCLPLQRSPICCRFCSGLANVLHLQKFLSQHILAVILLLVSGITGFACRTGQLQQYLELQPVVYCP